MKLRRATPALTLAFLILSASCAHGLVDSSSGVDGDAPATQPVVDGGSSSDESVIANDSSTVAADAVATDSRAVTDSSVCPPNWKSPTTPAGCHCAPPKPCTPNGCYGGYWCDTSGLTCHATPPTGCM